MNYRRSLGEVSGDAGEGRAMPPALRGTGRPCLVNRREDRAKFAALRPDAEPTGHPECRHQPMMAGKARAPDPEGARAAILKVATRIFASRGFVGASMRDISGAAGIKKPLIYHHFGSKAGLYAAVKQNLAAACGRQSEGIDNTDEGPADPRAELRRLVETLRDN
jgi:hypothetical protein